MPNERDFSDPFGDVHGHERRLESLEEWIKRHEEITGERVERLVALEQQMLSVHEWRRDVQRLMFFAIAQTIAIVGTIVAILLKR